MPKKGYKYVAKNITRKEFRAAAQDMAACFVPVPGDKAAGMDAAREATSAVGGIVMPTALAPKEFKTGTLGWGAVQKVLIPVNGKQVLCQLNISLSVLGSKQLPEDDNGGAAA